MLRRVLGMHSMVEINKVDGAWNVSLPAFTPSILFLHSLANWWEEVAEGTDEGTLNARSANSASITASYIARWVVAYQLCRDWIGR